MILEMAANPLSANISSGYKNVDTSATLACRLWLATSLFRLRLFAPRAAGNACVLGIPLLSRSWESRV